MMGIKGAIKGCGLKGCSLNVSNEKLGVLEEFVRMIAKGDMNCLFVFGEGGVGKTETILRTLETEDVQAVYLNGVVTPLELYHLLYEHNGKLIVLDDIEGVLNNPRAVAFLKAATYGYKDKRIICYPTSSPLLRAPESFEFTGKIILCMNQFPDNPSLEALYRRTLYYELRLSLREKITLFRELSQRTYKGIELNKRNMVCEYVISRSSEATKRLSIRELFKSFEIYKANTSDWKKLVCMMLQVDTDIEAYLKAVRIGSNINSHIRAFREMTGKSKSTFFRIKRRLGDL